MMSGIKPITIYFKVRSKDELEVEELLLSQLSRHFKAASLDSSRTISTVSSKVISIVVDLSKDDSSINKDDINKVELTNYKQKPIF